MRVIQPYDLYGYTPFPIPVGSHGDCFDRYLLRVEEMRSSLLIMDQCLSMATKPYGLSLEPSVSHKWTPPSRQAMKFFMESLIHHFKYYSEGPTLPRADTYTVVEAPKGEFGVYLLSEGGSRPQRCRIKSPGFLHLQGLDMMCRGLLLADLVTVVGTQDLVFGEIDR